MNLLFYGGFIIYPISIAILDSGIYPHKDFDSRIIGFYDTIHQLPSPYDDCGHGTHVSGIIAGSGICSNYRIKGIFPEGFLIGVKVLDENGNGQIQNVIDGINWIISNINKYNIKVANVSFGTTTFDNPGDAHLLETAIERLWDNNVVVVAAAGNDGPKPFTIATPGTCKKIITVGAYNDKTFRSGRGPTNECIVKPELVVNGNNILSTSNHNNGYIYKSGTSMSAPLVSGYIAKLLSTKNLSPKEIKLRLKRSCKKINIPANQQGWGKLDINKFLEANLTN